MKIVNHNKIFLLIGAAIFLIFINLYFFVYADEAKYLEVHFLDVGQGDAIFVRTTGGHKILIDGGPDSRVIGQLDGKMDYWEKEIDIMILTHPHSDHVAGLIDVLKKYQVNKVYYTGVLHTSPEFIRWMELIHEREIPFFQVKARQNLIFDDNTRIEFLYPDRDISNEKNDNLNNTSIILKIIHGKISFLLTGDAESEIENLLLAKNENLQADVIKLGHHGSKTASSPEFLKAVSAQVSVIQVGENNDFFMPHLRTLKSVQGQGGKIYRNDLQGCISIKSDEKSYWVKSEK